MIFKLYSILMYVMSVKNQSNPTYLCVSCLEIYILISNFLLFPPLYTFRSLVYVIDDAWHVSLILFERACPLTQLVIATCFIICSTAEKLLSRKWPKKPIKYSVLDAFTDTAFKGNPAAVCLLEEERDEEWLQLLASEFNISETCYLTRITESGTHSNSPIDSLIPRFRLRWFTPVAEVDLCGHATLAAAHLLFTSGLINSNTIEFSTLSGILTAKRVSEENKLNPLKFENGESKDSFSFELDFPVVPITEFKSSEVSLISKALSDAPIMEIMKTTTSEDLFIVLPSGKMVADFDPHFDEMQKCPGSGIIITGVAPPESGFDFYCRYFCPKFGIKEDPVTGSAHCALAPYWSKKLGKSDFVAYQASPRSGVINLHLDEQNKRVMLRGKAITVMEGSILV